MFCEIDGIKINYIDKGCGPTVLMLHGWGSRSDLYSGIIDRFCDRLRFVAPDFPGCGQSGVMDTPWTVADYSDFVLKFIEKLGLEVDCFVGHSHGGRVILYMAGSKLIDPKKIVLFGSAGIVGKKPLKTRIKIKTFKACKKVLCAPVIKNFSGDALQRLQAHFGSADYAAANPVLRKTMVNVVNTDVSHLIPEIKCPTLLIWGENDTDTPLENAHKMEKLIKDCGLCVIKGAGHFSFLEKPFEIQAILDSFLIEKGV